MTSDELKDKVAAIARQAMQAARSSMNIAVGNTLVITVPLVGIDVPDDMADLVRSVAE